MNHFVFKPIGLMATGTNTVHIKIPIPVNAFIDDLIQLTEHIRTIGWNAGTVTAPLIERIAKTKVDTANKFILELQKLFQLLPYSTNRNKRFLDFIGALTGSIGMAYSFYNSAQIAKLQHNFDINNGKIKNLIDISEDQEYTLKHLQTEIAKSAEHFKAQSPITDPLMILQLPTSYFYDQKDGIFNLYIHCKVYQSHNTLSVYEYQELPVFAATSKNNTFIPHLEENTILAIGQSDC